MTDEVSRTLETMADAIAEIEALRTALTGARAEVGRQGTSLNTLRKERADWMRCSANDMEVRKAEARATAAESERDELAAQLAALHKLYGERCDLPARGRQIMDIVEAAVEWHANPTKPESSWSLEGAVRAYTGEGE